MSTRIKKNKLWNFNNEEIVIKFYEGQTILWQAKNQKDAKETRSALLEVLRTQLKNLFTGNNYINLIMSSPNYNPVQIDLLQTLPSVPMHIIL